MEDKIPRMRRKPTLKINEETNREGVASRDGLGGFESSERIEEEMADAVVSRTREKFTSG